MLKAPLQTIVEELCNHGCRQVNTCISQIEAGKLPATMLKLSKRDQQAVLGELKSIMAVYDRCDPK